MKYAGNIVIKREHLVKIVLDKKGQVFFDQMQEKILKNEFTNEQAMRKVAVEERNEEFIEKMNKEGEKRVEETIQQMLS